MADYSLCLIPLDVFEFGLWNQSGCRHSFSGLIIYFYTSRGKNSERLLHIIFYFPSFFLFKNTFQYLQNKSSFLGYFICVENGFKRKFTDEIFSVFLQL